MARKRDAAGRTPDDKGYQPTYSDDMTLWTKQIIFGVHEAGTNRANRYRYEPVPGDSFMLCDGTTGWSKHLFSVHECGLPLYMRFGYKITLCGHQAATPGEKRAVGAGYEAMVYEPISLATYLADCETKPGFPRPQPPKGTYLCANCHGQLLAFLGVEERPIPPPKRQAAPKPATMPERLEFLVLGHSPDGASGYPHPVSISVHSRGERTLINFSLGPHLVNVGGQRGVKHVIPDGQANESFAQEFDACEARWLVPYLARLAVGEDVTDAELMTAYEAKNGHSPKREWSADYTY